MPDDKQPKLFPPLKLVALAAVAGLAAGAAAVYVSGGFDGNKGLPAGPPVAAVSGEKSPDDLACAAKAGAAKELAKKAVGQVAALTAADPPRSLKSLAFNGPDGKPTTLGNLAGKTALMNLWATWCAPCRAEMPALDALQKAKGGDRFEVVAVNVDTGDDTKPKKFLADTGVSSLGYYRENTLGLFETLKEGGLALGLPVTLLIDKQGCLLANMNGPAEWSGEDAQRLIEAAIGG